MENRVAAWDDTRRRTNRIDFPAPELITFPPAVPGSLPLPRPAWWYVDVRNEDCIVDAAELAETHSEVGILNMASATHPGGGVRWGARAQEEELCRRSNLKKGLDESYAEHYPLHGKVLTHKNVIFFKKGAVANYRSVQRKKQFKATVFTSPAIKWNYPPSMADGHCEAMRERVDTLVTAVERSGVMAVVLGAWGCGAYGLNPKMMATLFKERLLTTSIPVVHFAILNDHNGEANYEAFRDVFTCNSLQDKQRSRPGGQELPAAKRRTEDPK